MMREERDEGDEKGKEDTELDFRETEKETQGEKGNSRIER